MTDYQSNKKIVKSYLKSERLRIEKMIKRKYTITEELVSFVVSYLFSVDKYDFKSVCSAIIQYGLMGAMERLRICKVSNGKS